MDPKFLFETTYWKVILLPLQAYIGRAEIILKRHAGTISDLSEEEMADFLKLVQRYEAVCKKLFEATCFNWTFMVNNSYKEKPYHPHAHWHVRPRYDHPVVFEGKTFEDMEFGDHYDRVREKDFETSPELLQKIVEKLRSELNY